MYLIRRNIRRGHMRKIARSLKGPYYLAENRITEASDDRITEASDNRVTQRSK